jgi:signal transduction histidine kinase
MARLKLLVNIRWIAAGGIVLITVGARYVFHINFPTLPVYIIAGVIAVYNLVLIWQIKELARRPDAVIVKKGRRIFYFSILIDMFALIVLIHYSGGIENPFIFFFIFHIILASIELKSKWVYLLSAIAAVLVALLVTLEFTGAIPHVNLEGFVLPIRYQEPSRVLAVVLTLTALLFGTSFIITSVVGELNKRQRHLEEQRQRFLRFIGMAAHDLKAPLGAIQGFLWVMRDGFAGEVPEKQRGLLERSSRRIDELLALISDLLDIPRIEAGQVIDEMKDISLDEVISYCVENQRVLAGEKGLELAVTVPAGLPGIRGSEPRLQQALINLVNNAIKYTPAGSVAIRVQEQRRDLLVEISDTGIGIPPGELPHIFEDFYRASNAGASKGTGLGLSITRRIIETHGGRLRVESPCAETNTGTKFSFTLPKAGK